MSTSQKIIADFLGLPVEAMPAVQWYDDDDDMGNAYDYLRDAALPTGEQKMNHMGLRLRLRADRPEWRDGVLVVC